MSFTPLGRAAAAVVMSLIAAATVVSLTRSDAASTHTAAAPHEADLPGLAAAAPEVAARPTPAPTESSDEPVADESRDAASSTTPTTTAPRHVTRTTSPPKKVTPSPTTTSAPPAADPAPSPTPSHRPGLLETVAKLLGAK